ncbi:MAG TPA: endolytic transglycosylase MltG [Candidatus Polarisedimenticolia bacterium]|nr:endolytic transglycosylase MltG [Candidatus Polarisedimenticolia bacterium]
MKLGPALVVAAAVVCCAIAVGSLFYQGNLPFQGYEESAATVVIEQGDTARAAARRLQQAGVIRSATVFRLLMRLRGADARIHAGEYEFSGRLSPSQVLDRLVRGDVIKHRLTIPEGLRLDEIASTVASAGFSSREEILAATRDPSPIADLDPRAADLEGYLFPDTYFFARGVSAERIVHEMISRFRKEMTQEKLDRGEALGLNVRQVVTLASLVEEEARLDEERTRISAVFHNRLKSRMLLQCDPTVVYALIREGRYRGDIYRSDLAFRSPYNTYVHAGLPPGPICSPGARSIDAALNPAQTRDLFFVVSGSGRHEFSTNIDDHEQAVRRYRRNLGVFNRRPPSSR